MRKGTILLVSDAMGSNLASRLESAGWALLSARLREALAVLFVNRRIEAVVLDPGDRAADVLVLARGLRALRPDVPIFLVTAAPEAAEQASSIKDCYLVGKDAEQVAAQLQSAMLRQAV
jgi:DNA-binding response OmpR family regulator